LMGWACLFGSLSWAPVFLYAGAVVWTIGYDTIYAHQDKEDDALVGVRSTALLFGADTKPWLVKLYGLTFVLMLLAYIAGGAGFFGYLGLIIGAGLLVWQIIILDIDDADQCLKLFKSNNRVGVIVFLGLVLSLIA
jgi:4-hydroxybenzoate polyprenyltransferase